MSACEVSSKPPSRRHLLCGAIAAGVSPLFLTTAAKAYAADGPVEFADGFANTQAVYKMLTTFGDTAVYGGLTGIFYALINEDVIPMFGYCGYRLHQSRIVKGADGGRIIETRGKEAGLYTDLATGQMIETWQNPWTGERVLTSPWLDTGRCGVVKTEMPAGSFEAHAFGAQMYGGLARKPAAKDAPAIPAKLAWKKVGDQYLTSVDSSVRFLNPVTPAGWPKASTGEFVTESELMKAFTSVRAIDDPSTPDAPMMGVLTRDVPWLPFLRMGQSPVVGRMMGILQIYKVTGKITDVPAPMRTYLERQHPELLTPMTSWDHVTAKSGGTWQYYAKTTPPETPGYKIES